MSSATLVSSLGSLALDSESFSLRESAAEVLLDLATRKDMLLLIVAEARRGSLDDRIKVTVLLQVLAQSTRRAKCLAKAGVLEVLVDGLQQPESKELAVRSAAALADMLGSEDSRHGRRLRRLAARAGVLEAVAKILERAAAALEERQRSDAVVVAVSVMLCRIYALQTEYHSKMVALGLLPALLGVARQAGADIELLRAAMESIVRLCTYLSAHHGTSAGSDASGMSGAEQQMNALMQLGAADVVCACVRHEDQGVASWGIGLLHEFASRGAGKQQLAARPTLIRSLCRRLSTSKYAYTNQLILRSLWCLCTANRRALVALSEPHSLRRVLAVFSAVEDSDAHYWAVALASRLATLPSTHRWIMDSPLVRFLPMLITTPTPALRSTLVPEIATLLSRMAHCQATADLMAESLDATHACLLILESDSDSARLSMVMTIIRVAAMSRNFLRSIDGDTLRDCLATMTLDFSLKHTQLYAAKALITLVCARIDQPTSVPVVAAQFFEALNSTIVIAVGRLFGIKGLAPLPSGWQFTSYPQYIATANVLTSAIRVCAAEQTQKLGHFLLDTRMPHYLEDLVDFQMGLLAHIATCIAHGLDMVDDILDAVTASAAAYPDEYHMRMCVDIFVERYYYKEPLGVQDPHGLAALGDRIRLTGHALGTRDSALPVSPTWPDPDFHCSEYVRGLLLCRPEKPEEAKYPRMLSQPRLRDLLPIIEPSLAALAESLSETGAELQTPLITARALWIARILYYELPAGARGLVMRILAAIAPNSLSKLDSAGLVNLCRAYVVSEKDETDADSERASKYPDRAVSENESCFWAQIPGSTILESKSESRRSATAYLILYPMFMPETLQMSGLFYAQFALDRFVAKWFTSQELYACTGPPLSVTSEGALWTADRSGPPGSDSSDCQPTVFHECANIEAIALVRNSGSNAGSSGTTGAIAGADTSVEGSGGGSNGECVRVRPPSPFPVGRSAMDAIATDDSAASIYSAATLRARPLAVTLPGTSFHMYTPYYPSFSVLGDGCTIWNSGWKFSSVRMSTGIDSRLGGIHRYQVQLLSSGLMQIGWCTEMCMFLPESGEGVGDDSWSLAYDGYRQRKWHGLGD
ncbi:hypothetical protein J3B02_003632, partial [Coemansia erecta]